MNINSINICSFTKKYNPLKANKDPICAYDAKMSNSEFGEYLTFKDAIAESDSVFADAVSLFETASKLKLENIQPFYRIQAKNYTIYIEKDKNDKIFRISTHDGLTGKQNTYYYQDGIPRYAGIERNLLACYKKVYDFTRNPGIYTNFSYVPYSSTSQVSADEVIIARNNKIIECALPQEHEGNRKLAIEAAKALFGG